MGGRGFWRPWCSLFETANGEAAEVVVAQRWGSPPGEGLRSLKQIADESRGIQLPQVALALRMPTISRSCNELSSPTSSISHWVD